jgi:membrane fusion protein (multidrug efflux system)
MIGGILIVLAGSLVFWLMGGRYVTSDDTYVDAAKVSLSTDVSGLVDEVDVRENQHVTAGQVLFKIGQAGHRIAVANAQAQLAQVRLDVEGAKRAYAEAEENIALQSVQVKRDQDDLARYAAVLRDGGVTQSVYDDAKFQLQADQAKLNELQDEASIQVSKLADNPNIRPEDTPAYQSALANLQNAQLDLEDSVITAPYSGYVTMVDQLQPGMFLPAGTSAFGLVSDSDICVDTYPGQSWQGVVESISPASGSEFSILPAQNSSGNWVKVVQRIPVRVKITGGPSDFPLRAGMSAEISIDTQHHRHLSDLF